MPVSLTPNPDAQLIHQADDVQQRSAAQGDRSAADQGITHEGRRVSVDATSPETIAPGARQTSLPDTATSHRVAAGGDGFVNRPDGHAPRADIRKAGRLAKLGKRLKAAARRLIQKFFRSDRAAATGHGRVRAEGNKPVSGTTTTPNTGPARSANRLSGRNVTGEQHVQIKPLPAGDTATVVRDHSPDPVEPGKAFYREKQKDRSGLCGMHALNAFCGGPVIGSSEFIDRTVEIAAPLLEMQPEAYRDMIAGDQFDCSPEIVGQILTDLASGERADPAWKNTRVVTPLNIPEPGTPAHRQMTDRINAFPGDRMILGYSGGHGAGGHFVALRRDAGGKWQEVNSLDYVTRPKEIPDLGRYITQKSGVSLIHTEADFSFTGDRPVTPEQPAPADAASPGAGAVSELVRNHPVTLLAEAARIGVNASRNNVATKVLGDNNSMQEVNHVLRSGDGGIRRATTALNNIGKHRGAQLDSGRNRPDGSIAGGPGARNNRPAAIG